MADSERSTTSERRLYLGVGAGMLAMGGILFAIGGGNYALRRIFETRGVEAVATIVGAGRGAKGVNQYTVEFRDAAQQPRRGSFSDRARFQFGEVVAIDYLPDWPTFVRLDPKRSADSAGGETVFLIYGGVALAIGAIIVAARSSRRAGA